ncbi:type III-B CRISPR module RAMP protein Cmr4 [Marinifilum sp. D714]|uniref:type III-B CRISPR module RAMP protein Cmr4 n=1 Tax=Marinifilum sp. D714 TaxID=2937523 RepID=UPI0027BDAEAC|nr:type III-B CRISPR module RAMP protein Cmr4 [Marinifilum sp. D714]MDQ2178590.1 type III-B CRISPR module RAMP protein Cmr4 [Marinifilum sp. D714]
MNKKRYTIECLTNLHVGSGDINYGTIDRLVQRDAVTDLPTIHASGLKGALKEFFDANNEINNDFFSIVFGSVPNSRKTKSNKQNIGSYIFNDSHLLAFPLRANDAPYYMATCPEVFNKFTNANVPDINKAVLIGGERKNSQIEDLEENDFEEKDPFTEETTKLLKDQLGTKIIVLPFKEFKKYCNNLPAIARNYLENGESKNLWYEEVVPSKSIFWTDIIDGTETNEINKKIEDTFSKIEESSVQIGANASIGYGQCKFKSV